jgi:hypothetical protein
MLPHPTMRPVRRVDVPRPTADKGRRKRPTLEVRTRLSRGHLFPKDQAGPLGRRVRVLVRRTDRRIGMFRLTQLALERLASTTRLFPRLCAWGVL